MPLKRGLLILAAVACHAACTSKSGGHDHATATATAPSAGSTHFRYDSASGECRNGAGSAGFNQTTLAKLLETSDGECVDFAASGITSLNERGDFLTLRGWNLRGARLDTMATYTLLIDADLAGADLRSLRVFYYCVSGTTDAHTQIGERSSDCQAQAGQIRCGDSCED